MNLESTGVDNSDLDQGLQTVARRPDLVCREVFPVVSGVLPLLMPLVLPREILWAVASTQKSG